MSEISDTLIVTFDSSLDDKAAVCVSRVVNEKVVVLKMELGEQAERDALTGIRNRHAYDNEVKKIEWNMQGSGFREFGIAMIDLNYLKRYLML